MNLLSNAVKYTQKGTVTLEVRCTVQGEEALLHFKVQDTGIGIKAEDLEKLSNEFQRLDVSKNRDVEGTGLGLSISKQLLLLMGSELHISSEYGKGSEFSFELSQRIVNAEPLKDFRNRLQHMEAGEEGRIDYLAPDARVLVVDDNHMNLKVFKNLLKRTRMNIFEADSGAACLELLRKNRYHIVFVDHMMPEMDGVETLRAMKEEKLGEGASLIMFTANAIVGEKQKYIREGFDNFLSKPIIPDELDKMILKYLPSELVIYEQRMNVTDSIKADDTAQKQGSSPDVSVLDTLKEELPELDIAKGLATSCGDKDFYLELLNDFTELPIKNELNTYLRENNFKNYCIRIHAFKNSAYSVGAQALGDLAYQMECLTRQELPKQIEELQKELFAGFDRICEKYKGEKGEK